MGIIVNKEMEKRSELSDKVSSSLRERAERTSGEAKTDFVKGSEYSKGLKGSGKFSWIWFVLILLAAISLLVIFLL